jgi:hypothetical protein
LAAISQFQQFLVGKSAQHRRHISEDTFTWRVEALGKIVDDGFERCLTGASFDYGRS